MKHFLAFLILFAFSFANAQKKHEGTIYQFTVKDISGKKYPLSKLKGKKVMIVNTASKCGLTPQYEELEALYKKYKNQNFVIIGFPSNDFKQQDPGTNKEIAEFCKATFGITFPMMEKVVVKGEGLHPLYQFLTQKSKNGLEDAEVQWNFQKFLIGTNGKLEKVISPRTKPSDNEVINWIEAK